MDEVWELLSEMKLGVNCFGDLGSSLLSVAAQAEATGFVESILEAGADPNVGGLNELRKVQPIRHACVGPHALLEALLEAGADPTRVDPETDESPVMTARNWALDENVSLLREYAKPFLAKKKGASLVAKRSKRKADPATDRHAEHLRHLFVDEPRWEILATQASLEDTLTALSHVSLETHSDGHKRLVPEEKTQLFVLRFKGMPWTLCIKRLGYYGGDGREWLRDTGARLSETLGKALAFWGLQMFRCEAGSIEEERSWSIDDVDDERLDEDEGLVEAREAKLFAEMDAWLQEKDLLLPAMEDVSDGYCRKLAVIGVKKSDVEQMAVVDLERYE